MTAAAENDLEAIVAWTAERFGVRQARTYAATLSSAILALTDGPEIPGVKRRDDIVPGVATLHVARGRRKGRHFVVFRTARVQAKQVVEILRILHDAMDLVQHVHELEPDEG